MKCGFYGKFTKMKPKYFNFQVINCVKMADFARFCQNACSIQERVLLSQETYRCGLYLRASNIQERVAIEIL